MRRDVLVTGIGLVSCLGEGPHAHLAGLAADLVPTQDQACQLGTLTVLAETGDD